MKLYLPWFAVFQRASGYTLADVVDANAGWSAPTDLPTILPEAGYCVPVPHVLPAPGQRTGEALSVTRALLLCVQGSLYSQDQDRQGIVVCCDLELAVVHTLAVGRQIVDRVPQRAREVHFQPFGQNFPALRFGQQLT